MKKWLSYRTQIVCVLLLLISGFVLAPGCGMFASTDGVIGQVVEAGNSRRPEMVTPEGNFSDYQVYRKPDSDIVVFEHKMKPDLKLDKAMAASIEIKTDLISQFELADRKSVLDSGISLRVPVHRLQRRMTSVATRSPKTISNESNFLSIGSDASRKAKCSFHPLHDQRPIMFLMFGFSTLLKTPSKYSDSTEIKSKLCHLERSLL